MLAAITMTLALVLAQVSYADHKGYCPKLMTKMTQALSLDDAQVEKIKQLKQQAHLKMKDIKKRMKIIRGQIKNAVYSDKMNVSNLDAMIKIKAALLEQKMKIKYMMKHNVYNTLNADQKKKFKDFWAQKRKAYMKKHKHE